MNITLNKEEIPPHLMKYFRPASKIKPKNDAGLPWRVALALQADGWYLRSDVIWAKGISFCETYSGSSMPESVTDRPSKSHEYVFLLAKRPRYFFDMEAIREPHRHQRPEILATNAQAQQQARIVERQSWRTQDEYKDAMDGNRGKGRGTGSNKEAMFSMSESGRNPRSVWVINPENYSGAHFATWPTALVEKMVLAGTSAAGCCPACKAPWVRVTRKGEAEQAPRNPNPVRPYDADSGLTNGINGSTLHKVRQTETTGWRPGCECLKQHTLRVADGSGRSGEEWLRLADEAVKEFAPVPCTVLDPFTGSGATGVVARRHGRHFIGMDLSFAYLRDQAKERLGLAALERFEDGAAIRDDRDYSDLFKTQDEEVVKA